MPSNVQLSFKENYILEADEAITALDTAKDPNTIKSDRFYKKIILKAKEYKEIPLEEGQNRLDTINDLLDLINSWNKKHADLKPDDTVHLERQQKLKKLEEQLKNHRIDIHVRNREGEPIDPIKKSWSTYLARIIAENIDALADLEDRIETLSDIQEEVEAWASRNPLPLSEKEQLLKDALDKIESDLIKELEKLKQSLPEIRRENVRLILEKIKKASPEERDKLKDNAFFMWELSRSVPVA